MFYFLVQSSHLVVYYFFLLDFAVIDIDSVGTFRMCHHALKFLKKGGPGKDPSTGGTIINISAILHYGATWYQIHASAAKVSKFAQNLSF